MTPDSSHRTRETLQTGNLLSVINVLMQLRKVCNHPNMFEVRPTISPFQMEGITFHTPRLVCDLMEYDPFTVSLVRPLSAFGFGLSETDDNLSLIVGLNLFWSES